MWNREIISRFRVRVRIQVRGSGFGFGSGFAVPDFAVPGSGSLLKIWLVLVLQKRKTEKIIDNLKRRRLFQELF